LNCRRTALEHFHVSWKHKNALVFCFYAFSSREPESTSLENALEHFPLEGVTAEVAVMHGKTRLVLAVLAATALSLAFVDRPLATFAFQHWHGDRPIFAPLTRLVDGVEVLAAAGLICAGVRSARGIALGPRGVTMLRVSLAVFVALGVKDLAKTAFGRTWPETWTCGNPSFITDHVFGFSPFHGGAGYASFPSGHETVVAAFAAALWVLTPRFRWASIAAMLIVAIGLLGADYHWLSDILAGGLLGWLVGVFVAGAFSSEADTGSREENATKQEAGAPI
jgi:membrane-associated phospholipid phosphatase